MNIKGILKSKALLLLFSFLAVCCLIGAIQTDVTYGASRQTSMSQSDSQDVYPIRTPTLISAYGNNGGITITWEKSEGAELYRIFRKTADSNWVSVGTTSATQSTYKDTSVKPGTTYTYTVRTMDRTGTNYTSDYDVNGISVAYVATPVVSGLNKTVHGVNISWDVVPGAEKYRLYRHTGDGDLTVVATVSGTSYMDTSVTSGAHCYYRLRCVDASGKNFTSGYNTNDKYIYYVEAPELNSAYGDNGGVTVKWEPSAGASQYAILRKGEGSNWQRVGLVSSSKNSFRDSSAKTGAAYTYTVAAANRAGTGYTSVYDDEGLPVSYTATPNVSSLVKKTDGIQVSWKAVSGAEQYRLYRHTGDGKLTVVATVSGTSYTDTSVSSGKNYYYRLRCVDQDGNFISGYITNDKYVYYVETPKITAVYGDNGGLTVKWEPSAGASQYAILRKVEGGSWRQVALVSSGKTNYRDPSAKTGATYFYTVAAANRAGTGYTSVYDLNGSRISYVATPSVTSLTSEEQGVVVKWNAIPNAEQYRVYRHTGNHQLLTLGTTGSTQFTDTTAEVGETYYYRIRCVDRTGKQFTSGYLTEDQLSIRYLGNSSDEPDHPEVDPPVEEHEPDFSSVPRTLTLEIGDTYRLSESEIGYEIELATSDHSVVRVSGTTITAYGAGTATVTVTAGGESVRINVTVSEPVAEPEVEIHLDYSSMELTVGSGKQQVAMVSREPGTAIQLVWASSDETVATVTPTTALSAMVQAVGVGTAEISVSTNGVTETFPVTVTSKATINQTQISLNRDETYQLEVDGNYGPVRWSSSDPGVVTVEDGLLTAVRAGTATITAFFDNTSLTCTVSVMESSANKTELQSLYDEASELLDDAVLESYRTPESWSVLENAAQSAQTILEGTGANQEQIDQAAEQLKSAMDSLEAYTYEDGELVFYEKQSKQILEEINAFRVENGRKALEWSDNYARHCLAQGAYNSITYGLNYDARVSSDWVPAEHAGGYIGCCFYGRNVNSYQDVADMVLETFQSSPIHYANLLDDYDNLKYAGVSLCSYTVNGRSIFICIVGYGSRDPAMSASELADWIDWPTFEGITLESYGCTYEELYYMVG